MHRLPAEYRWEWLNHKVLQNQRWRAIPRSGAALCWALLSRFKTK